MNATSTSSLRSTARRVLVSLSLICAASPAISVPAYHLDILFGTGERFGSGSDINNAGQVVGTTGNTHDPLAIIWNNKSPTPLYSSLCCTYTETWAHAVNSFGQVAGEDTYQAAVWTSQTAIMLPSAGSTQSTALGINDAGQVVGFTGNFDSTGRATLWQNGSAIDLGTLGGSYSAAYDINGSGWVVGASQLAGSDSFRASLWRDGTVTALASPSGESSYAYGVNESGQIAGQAGSRAAVWTAGALSLIGAPGSAASDINNVGQVVGSFTDPESESANSRATLWSDGTAIDLNSFLSQADLATGWSLQSANAINDHGWITGSAYNESLGTRYAYLLSVVPAVPEAQSLLLMLAGLGVIGWTLKRTRGSRQDFMAAA